MSVYRSTGSGEAQIVIDPVEVVSELPSRPALIDVADRAWTAVATEQGLGGYETAIDGNDAVIRDVISPTRYTELRLRQTTEGAWYITEAVQRPSLEHEGFGGTVRETRSYPLDGVEPTTRSSTFGYFQDGELRFPEPNVAFGKPVTDQTCEQLLGQLREIMGEGQPARTPNRHGWLNWLSRK